MEVGGGVRKKKKNVWAWGTGLTRKSWAPHKNLSLTQVTTVGFLSQTDHFSPQSPTRLRSPEEENTFDGRNVLEISSWKNWRPRFKSVSMFNVYLRPLFTFYWPLLSKVRSQGFFSDIFTLDKKCPYVPSIYQVWCWCTLNSGNSSWPRLRAWSCCHVIGFCRNIYERGLGPRLGRKNIYYRKETFISFQFEFYVEILSWNFVWKKKQHKTRKFRE